MIYAFTSQIHLGFFIFFRELNFYFFIPPLRLSLWMYSIRDCSADLLYEYHDLLCSYRCCPSIFSLIYFYKVFLYFCPLPRLGYIQIALSFLFLLICFHSSMEGTFCFYEIVVTPTHRFSTL